MGVGYFIDCNGVLHYTLDVACRIKINGDVVLTVGIDGEVTGEYQLHRTIEDFMTSLGWESKTWLSNP